MPPEASGPPAAHAEPHQAPPLAIPLRAGPLWLVLDRGELRWIRLGEREVLRGIYTAVRETGWATVPAVIADLEIEAEPESFRARFVARHRRGDVRLDWDARIEGDAEGRITYSIDGVAGSTFLRNRIGFCVLHPAECAGRSCTIETVSGTRRAGVFPRLVSPYQPFLDLRAVTHEAAPGVLAEVRMEGETFEMEDQRNWSDASFKTYGTPLASPFPVTVEKGTRIRQSVSLRLLGSTGEPVVEVAAAVAGTLRHGGGIEPVLVQLEPDVIPRPAIGVAGAGTASLSEADAAALRRLTLDHVRADLHLEVDGWQPVIERAAANARRLGVPLELVLFLPEQPMPALLALARRAETLRPRVGHWLLFHAADLATHEGDAVAARRTLAAVDPEAGFGGGTDRHFAELNRRRPSSVGLDRLSFALTPQVHAFDDATLVESFGSLPWLAETARAFAPGLPLAISPVSLRPRIDPRPPSSRDPHEPPFTDDPRQPTPFAAAWTLGFLASASAAGFASLTLFELTGARGLVRDGRAFPVCDALADVAAMGRDAAVVPARSRRPARVQALGLRNGRRTRLFLANMTAEPHPVRIDGLTGTARRASLGAADPGESCGFEIRLAAHEVVRLDVESEP